MKHQDENLVPLQKLWDFVENMYDKYDVQDSSTTQTQKMDVNVLLYIQQALNETLFSRIIEVRKAKKTMRNIAG